MATLRYLLKRFSSAQASVTPYEPCPAPERRQFVRDVATAVAAGCLSGCFLQPSRWLSADSEVCGAQGAERAASDDSSVVEVHDPASVGGSEEAAIHAGVVRAMLEQGLVALVPGGRGRPLANLLGPLGRTGRVGIKVSCVGPTVRTSPAVVQALVANLRDQLGLSADRIVVWDAYQSDLAEAGFDEATLGVQVLGTQRSRHDDTGPGYVVDDCSQARERPLGISRILTEVTDVTIGCPPLLVDGERGALSALLTVQGLVDAGRQSSFDASVLSTASSLPTVQDRLRLVVIDALRAVPSGPLSTPSSEVTVVPRRLVMSRDPIAAETHAAAMVGRLGREAGSRAELLAHATATGPSRGRPAWVTAAEQRGLGSSDYHLVALQRLR